jgi:hypothetical protein
MVVTRAGVSTSTNQYLPSPSEGPQVSDNPRVQDPDDLANPVTREVSDSAPDILPLHLTKCDGAFCEDI